MKRWKKSGIYEYVLTREEKYLLCYTQYMISPQSSRDAVMTRLDSFLTQKMAEASEIHPSYVRLVQHIKDTVLAGGKYVRPHLVLLTYGSYDEQIAHVAAAHELLHAAVLVHDDIIDRDDVRRGRPTIHAAYRARYAPYLEDPQEREHFSHSAALLAGDLLIGFAYELIALAGLPGAEYQKATALISRGLFEVAGGELLDTEAPFIPGEYQPETVYRYKTASYSFVSPIMTGASLSPRDYDQVTLDSLRTYATNLGIAFQIQDDILGVFGDAAATGKSTTGDLREGKQTLLTHNFTACMDERQAALFDQTFGNATASDEAFDQLRTALRESGALAATHAANTRYTDQAITSAQAIKHDELRQLLLDFATRLLKRAS